MPVPAQTYASLAALEELAARAVASADSARRLHARVRQLTAIYTGKSLVSNVAVAFNASAPASATFGAL